jgi:hypothetical protein
MLCQAAVLACGEANFGGQRLVVVRSARGQRGSRRCLRPPMQPMGGTIGPTVTGLGSAVRELSTVPTRSRMLTEVVGSGPQGQSRIIVAVISRIAIAAKVLERVTRVRLDPRSYRFLRRNRQVSPNSGGFGRYPLDARWDKSTSRRPRCSVRAVGLSTRRAPFPGARWRDNLGNGQESAPDDGYQRRGRHQPTADPRPRQARSAGRPIAHLLRRSGPGRPRARRDNAGPVGMRGPSGQGLEDEVPMLPAPAQAASAANIENTHRSEAGPM